MTSPAEEILEDLLRLAEVPAGAGAVSFDGADPVLPTPLRIGDLGAASIGAAALQAARILEERGGPSQQIDVPVDAAAVGMRSSRYIRRVDGPNGDATPGPVPGISPVAFYRTRDERWVFFQRLFPHHFRRQLDVLGAEADEASIAAAVRRWDAVDLEDATADAGACAAMVRTHAEWQASEEGLAVSKMPLFSITRIGESDPLPTGMGPRPLSGVRVADLTRVLAGPTCGRTLAEHGADVLRIGTSALPDSEPMMRDTGHGKRSCSLDLHRAEDAERLRHLLAEADVFSQGFRPGAVANLGFGPEEVAALRPGIVVVTLSAFGDSGPWAERRGFDSVVQAASGVSQELAGADGVPRSVPANPLDYITGYLAAFLTMVALQRRAREGGSYHVQVSLAQTGRYLEDLGRTDATAAGARPADLPAERLAELMSETRTPFGRLRHFAPVARMSATPPRWDRPTVPLDHDRPTWLERG